MYTKAVQPCIMLADILMNDHCNRRHFLGTSLASALPASRPLQGANDRIGIGLIGCGARLTNALLKEIIQFKQDCNAEVRAVCDVWKQRREKAASTVKQAFGSEPRQTGNYLDVLSMKDIDAVVIAAPDHQHCRMLAAAVKAGKDAYIEKPLAMDMKELVMAVDAVKKSGRIVQVGTQIRSYPHSVAARDFVQGGGLGKILKVEQSRNAYEPYWRPRGRLEVSESDVDWKAFLMHHKHRPWDAEQFTAWYGHREFSRGPHTGLGAHFFDLVHFVTGAKFPVRATALGGVHRWKENRRDAPDSIEVVLEYPEGFLVRYSTVFGTGDCNYFKFIGTRGTIDAQRWSWTDPWTVTGQGSGEKDRIAAGTRLPEASSTPHMKNWLECVRSRKTPNASIDAGYQHAVVCIMADEAFLRGKRMVYDPAKRLIREG
jgi:predicted dehydrogenase